MAISTKMSDSDIAGSHFVPVTSTNHHDLGVWQKLKTVKSKDKLGKVDQIDTFDSFIKRAPVRKLRSSASQNFKDSIARSVRPKQSNRSLFQAFHGAFQYSPEHISDPPSKTGPFGVDSKSPSSWLSIPKFSWEDFPSSFGDKFDSSQVPWSPIPPSYVEVICPGLSYPQHPFCNCAANAHAAPPDYRPPVPPKDIKQSSQPIPSFSRPLRRNMPERPSSKRLSDSQSRSKKRDSGSGSSHRLSVQSNQSHRLSKSSARLSIQQSSTKESARPSPNPPNEDFLNSPRPTTGSSIDTPIAGFNSAANNAANNLGGLVCNVHRTTGNEPPALVGASTTIVGDKLFVFGGRRLSHRTSQLTRTLFELDLIRRHWTKLETHGQAPIPRYFHSMCPLGDSKLVCYGGMAQLPDSAPRSDSTSEEANMAVMSDVHILDIDTLTWSAIPTTNAPPGRYAHCATVLPSSGIFTSANAAQSSMQHNLPGSRPNQGSIGITLDGQGGAQMVIVGGQDSASRYIEQISIFNLRSFKWSSTTSFSRNFGAYRSVVTPLIGMRTSDIGSQQTPGEALIQDDSRRLAAEDDDDDEDKLDTSGAAMLLYSNYNFLDVKLELQIRLRNGTVVEKVMQGLQNPPGLRFPNGGIAAGHLIVSGTFLTSTKQEYNLWALNLRTLVWNRIEVGGTLSSGSWNRGNVWKGRNAYVVLGNRKRSLGDDYNHRRLNFTHLCIVELEAFGLYDNPGHPGNSVAPILDTSTERHAHSLGFNMLTHRDLTDMEILSLTGERIPINSRLVAYGWGPYFTQLIQEAGKEALANDSDGHRDSISNTTIHRRMHPSRSSSLTIVPSLHSSSGISSGTSFQSHRLSERTLTPDTSSLITNHTNTEKEDGNKLEPEATLIPPTRLLYLPHAPATIRALLHYLYTSTLPPPHHPLCTPQTLCSLLQLAKPYHIPGLLEATVQRLHQVLDAKSAAAVFNAAAMAAGSGEAVKAVVTGLRVGVEKEGNKTNSLKPHVLVSPARQAPNPPSANTSFASSDGATDTDADTSASEAGQANGRRNITTSGRTWRSGQPPASIPVTQSFAATESSTEDEDESNEESDAHISSANASFASAASASASATDTDTDTDGTTTDATTDASASEDAEDSENHSARNFHNPNATPTRRITDDRHATAQTNSGRIGPNNAASERHSHTQSQRDRERTWRGTWSPVVGLQKRSLRGLVEGRRAREDAGEHGSTGARGSIASVGSLGSLGSIVEAASGGGRREEDGEGSGRGGNSGLNVGHGLGVSGGD